MEKFYWILIKKAHNNFLGKYGKLSLYLGIILLILSPFNPEIGKFISDQWEGFPFPRWVVSFTLLGAYLLSVFCFILKEIYGDHEHLTMELDKIKKFFEPKFEIAFVKHRPFIHEMEEKDNKKNTLYRIGIKSLNPTTIKNAKVQIVSISPELPCNQFLPVSLIQMNTLEPFPETFDIQPGEGTKYMDVLRIRNHERENSSLELTCIAPREPFRYQLKNNKYEVEILVTGENILQERKIFEIFCNQENLFIFQESDQ